MTLIVADASVITKWFIEEEYSAEANMLREDYINQLIDIAVPQILYYEVLNALKYSYQFSEDELLSVGQALEDYQFLVIPLGGRYLEQTIRRAIIHGITIYDASYIAIGDVRKCKVFTADEKLLRKISGNAPLYHIRDYQKYRD